MAAVKQLARKSAPLSRDRAAQARRRKRAESSKIKAEIVALQRKIDQKLAELLARADRMMADLK